MSSPLIGSSSRGYQSDSLYRSLPYSFLIHAIVVSVIMMFSAADGPHQKKPKTSYTVSLGQLKSSLRTPVERAKKDAEKLPTARRTPTAAKKRSPRSETIETHAPSPGESHDLLALQRQSDGLLARMQTSARYPESSPLAPAKPAMHPAVSNNPPITKKTPPLPLQPSSPTYKTKPKSGPGKTLPRVKATVNLNQEIQIAQRELSRFQRFSEPSAVASRPRQSRTLIREKPREKVASALDTPLPLSPAGDTDRDVQKASLHLSASPKVIKSVAPAERGAITPGKEIPPPTDTAPTEPPEPVVTVVKEPVGDSDILTTVAHFSQTMPSLLDHSAALEDASPKSSSANASQMAQPEVLGIQPLLMRDIKIEVSSSPLEQLNVQLYKTMKVTSKGTSTYDASRRDGAVLETEYHERPDNEASAIQRILAVTSADEGAYCLVIENIHEDPITVDIVFRLYEGKDSQNIREFKHIMVAPHSTQKFSFLMPYTVFWDDDSYFSGKMENLKTITKFNYDTGIVWIRRKH